MSFEKGGIASKSNYNPVRQYINSKLHKYDDIFILANASSGHNFIYHIDIHQGYNVQNISLVEDLCSHQITQKAVVNEIVLTRLYNDQHGFRELCINNPYSVPELFVMLKTKYKILVCGIIHTNRKGCDQHVMNLSKSATRVNQKHFSLQSMGFCLDNGRIANCSCLYLLYHW